MSVKKLFNKLIESYIFVVLLALAAGIIFPAQAIKLAPYSTIFLGIIFFFSALKIDLKEVVGYLKDKKMLVVVNLFMLIILPIIVYYTTLAVIPELAIAFLILAAMPSGMTAPLLSEICGGRQSLALVLTISTSLLAPITVPLVIQIIIGTDITISFIEMFFALAKVIFIPFALANFVKYFWKSKIKATHFTFKPISIILLGLLIMGIIAKQSETIMTNLQGQFLIYLALLFVLFAVLHVIGYFTIFWRHKRDRISTTVCLTYMNFTLAIYLVGEFFTEPNIIIPVVLSVLPWSLLVIPYKYIMKGLNSAK
ncbi:MAG: bile acid:sodium symporter [Parcubacteria group bacterium]|nr:bile acid:sodium symporter [Parcubacteria group bacterium]